MAPNQIVVENIRKIYNNIQKGKYAPPFENVAGSLQLLVAPKCYLSCSFCTMYIDGKPSIRPVEDVKADIDRWVFLRDIGLLQKMGYLREGNGTTIFLQDGDVMHVKIDDLVEILDYARKKFGDVSRITSYGIARSILRKKPEDLRRLYESGLEKVHIGLESGHPVVLEEIINKKATPDEMVEAGKKIMEAGITLSEYVILGIGGKTLSNEHADATAEVLNKINPHYIGMRTLAMNYNTPLYQRVLSGEFDPIGEIGAIEEQERLIRGLEVTSQVANDHQTNLIYFPYIKFPDFKQGILSELREILDLSEDKKKRLVVSSRIPMIWQFGFMKEHRRSPTNKEFESVRESLQKEGESLLRQSMEEIDRYIFKKTLEIYD